MTFIATFTPASWDAQPADSKLITTCKVCRLGIYKGQPWAWLLAPVGISHEVCAPQRTVVR